MNNADMPAAFENNAFIAGGLTKREYFAGLAMLGWINHHARKGVYSFSEREAAENSVRCVDALLKELENG